MRQSISARFNSVVGGKVKELAFGQPHETDVSACFAPILDDEGNLTGFGQHWLITVSIPNPLQGNVDIAVSLPVGGVKPPDFIFERVAEQLFDSCLEQKRRVLNPEATPGPQLPNAVPAGAASAPRPRPAVAEAPTKPEAPRVKRERNTSFFPSKPGSELTAES